MPEIRSLTALRGIAALWIVLHHFWPQTNSASPFLIAKGYLAVDLFFILSGAVLYMIYAEKMRNGQFDLPHFAYKRFARLYPVHLVTLLLATLVLSGGPLIGFSGREMSYDLGQMFVLHATLMHAWGLTETGGLNYPSWSLSAEAFAYALFPALAYVIIKARHTLLSSLAFLIACMMLVQWVWPTELRNPSEPFVFTRLENDFGALRIVPEFLLGLAVAKHVLNAQLGHFWSMMGLSLVAIGLAVNFDPITVIGFAALIGGCMIADPKSPNLLHRLGEMSYSIYMVHALIQIVGFKIIEILFAFQDGEVPALFMIPLIGLTMLCAGVLHYGCERPARAWLLSLSSTKSVRSAALHSSPK